MVTAAVCWDLYSKLFINKIIINIKNNRGAYFFYIYNNFINKLFLLFILQHRAGVRPYT